EVTVTVKGGTEVKLKQTVTVAELDVSSLAAGEYTVAVVAIGGEGYTNSDAKTANFTVEEELEKLATPTGFAYANGKVTWNAVEGATAGYLVKVTKKDNTVAIDEKTVTTTELDVSTLAAGEYSVSVTAKAVDGQNAASLPAAYTITVPAAAQTLSTPSGASVDVANRKVTWNEVANATEYVVTIKVDGEEVEKETVNKAEYDISGLEDKNFELSVVAQAEGYTQSAAYTANLSITAIALDKVTDLAANSGNTVLSWKHVGGADHFRIVIKNGDKTELDKEVNTGVNGTYSLDISELATGNYTAQVYAIADEYDVFRNDSAAEEFAITVASLGAYEAVANIHVDGANIVWDKNNALGYEIVVTEKGKTQALDIKGVKAVGESFNFLATGLPKGDYTVSVTPKDSRHTGTATAATYDIALKNVKTFDAEAIAKFDGETANGGEHGKVTLLTKGEKKVAQVKPTVDGWGRVRSEAFIINYSNNPIVVIDVDEVVIGGYHLEVNIGGEKYKIIRDSMVVGGTIATFVPERENEEGKPAGITGLHESYLRLGVDHSTEN
ncbi:MAG: hypothetical protein K2J30_03960, partial [Clostridia bacterium]|nr:hypothetical protein [Clostridia bacterium]